MNAVNSSHTDPRPESAALPLFIIAGLVICLINVVIGFLFLIATGVAYYFRSNKTHQERIVTIEYHPDDEGTRRFQAIIGAVNRLTESSVVEVIPNKPSMMAALNSSGMPVRAIPMSQSGSPLVHGPRDGWMPIFPCRHSIAMAELSILCQPDWRSSIFHNLY
jgi:hypothetical protein